MLPITIVIHKLNGYELPYSIVTELMLVPKPVNEWVCSVQLFSVFGTQWRCFHPFCDAIVDGGGEMCIWRCTFVAIHIRGLSKYIIAPTM